MTERTGCEFDACGRRATHPMKTQSGERRYCKPHYETMSSVVEGSQGWDL